MSMSISTRATAASSSAPSPSRERSIGSKPSAVFPANCACPASRRSSRSNRAPSYRGAAASIRAIIFPPRRSQPDNRQRPYAVIGASKTGCIGCWTWSFAKTNPVTEKATARRTWPSSHISPSTSSDPQSTNEASSCAEKSPDGTQITSPTCSTRQAVTLDSLPCARRPAARAHGASFEGGVSTRPSRRRSERISPRKSQ
jgi:hypothetical protein